MWARPPKHPREFSENCPIIFRDFFLFRQKRRNRSSHPAKTALSCQKRRSDGAQLLFNQKNKNKKNIFFEGIRTPDLGGSNVVTPTGIYAHRRAQARKCSRTTVWSRCFSHVCRPCGEGLTPAVLFRNAASCLMSLLVIDASYVTGY